MKKFISLALALVMALSLCAPAVAAPDARPMWQQWGHESLSSYLTQSGNSEWDYYSFYATPAEQTAWTEAWFAAHPDVAFDANTYFMAQYPGTGKDNFMSDPAFKTDDDFKRRMATEYVAARVEWAAQYDAASAWLAGREGENFDPDAVYAEHYAGQGYEDKADYMRQRGQISQREFYTDMLITYRDETENVEYALSVWRAIQTSDPEGVLTTKFLADLPNLLREYGYESIEDCMARFRYRRIEQVYANYFGMWKDDYQQKEAVAQRLTALGGTPGQINVLYNDKCLTFPDQLPTAKNGVLSVPADVLSKALSVSVTADADGYAPLRANAEAVGCYVSWDDYYQTAVVVDRAKTVAEIDRRFTSLSKLWDGLAALYQRNRGQVCQIDDALTFNLTALNSMDGDKTYTAKVKGSATTQNGVLAASLTIDLSGVANKLSPELRDAIVDSLPKKLTFSQLAQLVGGVKVDIILNPSEALYFKAPVLASLLEGYDADSWVRVDLSRRSSEAVNGPTLSLGAYLYDYNVSGYGFRGIDLYGILMEKADTAAAFVGDGRFTEKNGTLTYKLDAKTVNDFIRAGINTDGSAPIPDFFRAADVSATLTEGGKLTLTADVRPNTDAYAAQISGGSNTLLWSYLCALLDVRFTVDLDAAAEQTSLTAAFHWRNQIKTDISYTSAAKKTAATPSPIPPEGAKVKDWSEIRCLLPF